MNARTPRYHELHRRLGSARRVLLATHERADGDAFGSLLGFRRLLPSGGEVVLLAPDSAPRDFDYLDGITQVLTEAADLRLDAFDAVVMFDCGDVKRTHLAEKLLFLGSHRPWTAVIDHHPTVTVFRGVELVDLAVIERGASSTCELVFEYARDNALSVEPATATALLTGVITDTGAFTNLATTTASLDIASELMRRGARLRTIIEAAFRSKSVATLQLWGRALSRLEHDPVSGVVSTALTLADLEECQVERDATEGIANFLNGLGEGKLVMVLREERNGQVKGSLRTKRPDVDVAAIAKQYGGGGHTKAAGFTVAGKIIKNDRGWSVAPAVV